MKLSRRGPVIALLFLATCSEDAAQQGGRSIEPAIKSIGKVPPSEAAAWQKAGASNTPDGRYLQAAAFDEMRKVLIMFGGQNSDPNSYLPVPYKDTWEWSPATGRWSNRTVAGNAPEARSGAGMVYDSQRGKLVLFGGRAGSGLNFEDTWEWDPASGAWTNISGPGSHPPARSQPAMVYQKSTGKILLFGGGRSDPNASDGATMTKSLGDTWEFDPTSSTWTALSPASAPSPRHDMGAAWDSVRQRVVIFGGMQTEIANASGVPKQDTWEWDPATSAWTERTSAGNKPSQRFAHSMAFDSARGRVLVFGGFDITNGGFLNDLWEWDPASGAWSQRTSTTGSWPTGREYASLVAIESSGRLELVAGVRPYDPYGAGGTGGTYYGSGPIMNYGTSGSRDVWELDPATAVFTDRTAPLDIPAPRGNLAMAYYPPTGKVYIFGGCDGMMGLTFGDLWEWNGTTWAQVSSSNGPQARCDSAMAYDPVRKSLILFGGTSYQGRMDAFPETWEWTNSGGWAQLKPLGSPAPMYGHGMVTDTVRNKVLLFGGLSYKYYYGPDGGIYVPPPMDPLRNEVWEWDGGTLTWTNRTPVTSMQAPRGRQYPVLAFDEARGKLFLYEGPNNSWSSGASTSGYWEWDPSTAGWALRDPKDWLQTSYNAYAVYDSIRRREVLFTDTSSSTGTNETWELDARGPTWYVRTLWGTPESRSNAAMAFDAGRGVVVLFGGMRNDSTMTNETWEYRVTQWGDGTGCTAAFAASCASGYCVEGVCCQSAACTGPCQSCSVAGAEGTCVPAKPGTEVPGSCDQGLACDGKGNCLGKNGQPCAGPSTCASGFCTDGVCCENACSGPCASCALTGQVGKCTPYPAGKDPQSECGKGDGVCASTCDGVGACVFPGSGQPCAYCMACDGFGKCGAYDPYCRYSGGGGAGGGAGGSGGYPRGGAGGYPLGGSGGSVRGGAGGYPSGGYASGGYPSGGYPSGGSVRSGGYASGGYPSGGYPSGGSVRSGGYASGGYVSGGYPSGGYPSGGSVRSGGYPAGGSSGGSGGTPSGGAGGSVVGGSGGKRDGGPRDGLGSNPVGGEIIGTGRLHRTGCYCTLGSRRADAAPGLTIPLLTLGAVVLWRARWRRRR
jgi:hypothetical protein